MNAVAVTLLTLVVVIGPRTDAQEQSTTVSTIASVTTDTFTDAATKGRPESDFKDKWIRFVTAAHPDGFLTRVKSFDPTTGRFTLYDQIPAGVVKQNDVYQLANSPASLPPAGLFRPAADVACAPVGTNAPNVIACTGADTTGVVANGGNDTVTVVAGASVNVSAAGILKPASIAVSGGDGHDTVTNAGAVSASATAVLTPVLTPPSPVPGLSKVWGAAIATGPDAKGIDGGAGNDTITNTNTGSVAANATSVLLPSIVNGTAEGLSKADVSSTSKATATAIAGGEGGDTLTNNGTLDPSATATALGVNLVMTSVVEAGKGGTSTVKGEVKANSTAAGLSGGGGQRHRHQQCRLRSNVDGGIDRRCGFHARCERQRRGKRQGDRRGGGSRHRTWRRQRYAHERRQHHGSRERHCGCGERLDRREQSAADGQEGKGQSGRRRRRHRQCVHHRHRRRRPEHEHGDRSRSDQRRFHAGIELQTDVGVRQRQRPRDQFGVGWRRRDGAERRHRGRSGDVD